MKQPQQKLKLLYLMKILLEKTDEEHHITVPEMIRELEALGISAERKSVYSDLEYLQLYGLDICSERSKTHGYYVASREFELPELKLLVDSVQASKFITRKKSLELISKIEKLTSHDNAKKLHRQVYVLDRVKTMNEQIYYNVDKIHDAIAADKQITFRYFDYNVDKQKVYRKEGKEYQETPVALTWDDENYYMIAYKPKYDHFTHYRVDRMDSISVTEHPRVMPEKEFDLSKYSRSVFSMFGGEETDVSLWFDNSLVGVVFDRFGTDIPIRKVDESHFTCDVKVAVSPHFLTWMMSFGTRAKILSPEPVVEELKRLISDMQNVYGM